MNDGPVGSERTDRIEGRLQITVLLRAEMFELICCAHFSQRFSCIRIFQRVLTLVLSGCHTACFKPVHEFCAGGGIFEMGTSDVPDLCIVFPAFHQDFRIFLPDDLCPVRDVPVKRVVHPVRIQQDPRPFRKHGDCPVNPVVRFHDDALFFKRSKDAVREFIPIGK